MSERIAPHPAPLIMALDNRASAPGQHHFRISGGVIRTDWAASLKPGETPWCEFSIWGDNVGSYGGSVWPTAWPDLFEALPSTAQSGSGRLRLTEQGKALLLAGRT